MSKFAIMRNNDTFVAYIVNTRMTKVFRAVFALAEKLPTSTTLTWSITCRYTKMLNQHCWCLKDLISLMPNNTAVVMSMIWFEELSEPEERSVDQEEVDQPDSCEKVIEVGYLFSCVRVFVSVCRKPGSFVCFCVCVCVYKCLCVRIRWEKKGALSVFLCAFVVIVSVNTE